MKVFWYWINNIHCKSLVNGWQFVGGDLDTNGEEKRPKSGRRTKLWKQIRPKIFPNFAKKAIFSQTINPRSRMDWLSQFEALVVLILTLLGSVVTLTIIRPLLHETKLNAFTLYMHTMFPPPPPSFPINPPICIAWDFGGFTSSPQLTDFVSKDNLNIWKTSEKWVLRGWSNQILI